MSISHPLPFDEGSAVIRLEDGRVARVVRSHHASPRERWQMWKQLRAATAEASDQPMTRKKRRKLNRMFLATVLNPDCKACWYGITEE